MKDKHRGLKDEYRSLPDGGDTVTRHNGEFGYRTISVVREDQADRWSVRVIFFQRRKEQEYYFPDVDGDTDLQIFKYLNNVFNTTPEKLGDPTWQEAFLMEFHL